MIGFFRKLLFGKTIQEKIFDDEVKLNGFKAKYESAIRICQAQRMIHIFEQKDINHVAEQIGKLEKRLELNKKELKNG